MSAAGEPPSAAPAQMAQRRVDSPPKLPRRPRHGFGFTLQNNPTLKLQSRPSRVEAHPIAVPADDQPIAVVFDLMHPLRADRRSFGWDRLHVLGRSRFISRPGWQRTKPLSSRCRLNWQLVRNTTGGAAGPYHLVEVGSSDHALRFRGSGSRFPYLHLLHLLRLLC